MFCFYPNFSSLINFYCWAILLYNQIITNCVFSLFNLILKRLDWQFIFQISWNSIVFYTIWFDSMLFNSTRKIYVMSVCWLFFIVCTIIIRYQIINTLIVIPLLFIIIFSFLSYISHFMSHTKIIYTQIFLKKIGQLFKKELKYM